MADITIRNIDYADPGDAADLMELLDYYARDPMGGGEPLNPEAKATLAAKMQDYPTAFSLIAYSDGAPAGLANCFVGFSTFAAKPLVNIHDVIVKSEFRGQGVGKALFAEIETIAADKGACKVTLEVLSGNEPAKALYASLGYGDYQLDPDMGHALFWQKELAA
ncbi:GNAT family N-acetyltransferase [Erythrobacter ani]|uniref:GNAT family N-acetyltransferase n=1 Tax=Erythrobacter ani TaxID=2827235 RepID=A0ABS6SKG6_9SPHN|nr:GNAT family N-acetyltransferase [Erythrobacter ani]MBV7265534.1 GNAT family N-acetyltransferase [Erythrobacter ani]